MWQTGAAAMALTLGGWVAGHGTRTDRTGWWMDGG